MLLKAALKHTWLAYTKRINPTGSLLAGSKSEPIIWMKIVN